MKEEFIKRGTLFKTKRFLSFGTGEEFNEGEEGFVIGVGGIDCNYIKVNFYSQIHESYYYVIKYDIKIINEEFITDEDFLI